MDIKDSWKKKNVAGQQLNLINKELQDHINHNVFSTFIEQITYILLNSSEKQLSLLDLGCGVGHYSELVKRHFKDSIAYSGSDYAPSMIETAQRRFPEYNFFILDLFDDTVDLSRYDILMASGLIDILDDYKKPLSILLNSNCPYVFIHRQRLSGSPSSIVVCNGYSGQKTFRCIINREEFYNIIALSNYELDNEIIVDTMVGDLNNYSILLKRK